MVTVSKLIIAVILLSPVCAFPQCKYLVNEKDEFTGEYEQQLDIASIGRQVWGSVGRSDSSYYIAVSADIGCVTDKSKLYIKFSDNTVLELTHISKIDCKNVVTFISWITDDLEKLKTTTVAKGRLTGTERSVDFDFKDSHYIIKSLACLK